ncbi:MAG: S8 family serine peptidase [Ignisphaera sp.]|uniref:Peptidase S8/S53 domain-containing protein n=1 Tax=Ignisphaera aggregans TaxID=334771 RepID=A0A7J3I8G5_9CREN
MLLISTIALVAPLQTVGALQQKVRVIVGVNSREIALHRGKLAEIGAIVGEIPELGAVVLEIPISAVIRIRGLPFVKYVEEDYVIEMIGKTSAPPGKSRPKISLVSYTSSVTVEPGGIGEVSFTLRNSGTADATIIVELRNENSIAIAGKNLVVPAGASVTDNLTFTAPTTPGTYTWSLVVVDAIDRTTVYASGTVTVNVSSSSTQPSSSPDPTYTDTVGWNVKMINATQVWSTSASHGDAAYGYHTVVQVAIVDTGIDYTHRDLSGAVVWCVVSLNATRVFYRGFDLANCADPHGHGTHVAGIVAARLNNWGIAGVAPKSVLYAIRVLDASGKGYASDIARGIVESVKGPDGLVGTEDDADVISMSLGGASSTVLYDAVRYAYSNGAVLVAAAGNSGGSSPVCPACYPEVIAVGAIDRYYAVPSWSNRNPDVVAPGSGVLSTYPGNRHVIASGTSMACPHVSAAVALVQAVRLATGRQKLAPAQMIELIRTTAIDLGTAGYDALYGYGLIDAYRAVSESMTRFN